MDDDDFLEEIVRGRSARKPEFVELIEEEQRRRCEPNEGLSDSSS